MASLVLLALEQHSPLTRMRTLLSPVSYPLQKLVSGSTHLLNETLDALSTQASLLAENQRLRSELLLLKGRQTRLDSLEQENTRLRGLLDTSFKVGDQVLIVEPLSINLDPFENLIAINKGSRFGVFEGQAVLDANGIVGRVLHVTPYTADVVMITDTSHAIPVQVNRNGLRTIAIGTGRVDRLELPYLPANSDVKEGDLLVTSGLGGGFPPGYPVARIVSINAGTDRIGVIGAVPVASLDRSHELLLVWSNNTPLPRIPGTASEASIPADPHVAK